MNKTGLSLLGAPKGIHPELHTLVEE